MTNAPHHGKKRGIGNRIAPPRFILYALGLAVVAVWAVLSKAGLVHFLIGFDIVTAVFLASLYPLFKSQSPDDIARHATENDANRVAMLVISMGVAGVVLSALALIVTGKDEYSAVLVVATLAIAWIFANIVYALHYAHLFYSGGKASEKYAGGLDIPSTKTPLYGDFVHFALILGMTFQTADIDITSTAIRRVSTWHCLEAFVFNIGVLAFTINMIAGQ